MTAAPLVEFDLVIRSSIGIAAPPEDVWPHLSRVDGWKSSVVSLERLAGEPGAEGETLRIGQRPSDVTVHTIMRTLRAIPAEWQVQSLRTEDGQATDGYVAYTLEPDGGGTWVSCQVLARCRVPLPSGIATADEFARLANESTRAKLDADHAALKRLLEAPRR